jgi:peptidoglycan/xylan/chitin deacetylase (PgdA/CDA1 family)
VGAFAALGAVVVTTSGGPATQVGASLGAGSGNALVTLAPDDGPASVPATVASTPAETLPAPTPMALPAGPAAAVSRVETADPVLFLGIDDGLTRDPAVLDYLEANQIPFTSFLVTSALQADPAYWARGREIGSTVEAHSITHPDLTTISADQVRTELCGSADTIEQVTGRRPTLFRPPYGKYDATVQSIAWECGYSALVLWRGSTNDGRVDLQEGELKPGDILLMHWRPDLLENLQHVKELADSQGFRIARLEEYLQPVP